MHAYGLTDVFLAVNGESTLDDVNDLTIMGHRDRLGGIEGAVDILLIDDATRNANGSFTIGGRHLCTGQVDDRAGDLITGGAFCFFNRTGDRFRGGVDIDHSAFAQAPGGFDPYAEDFNVIAILNSGNQGTDLRGPYINSNNNCFFFHVSAPNDKKVRVEIPYLSILVASFYPVWL